MQYKPDIPMKEAASMHRSLKPLLKRAGYRKDRVTVVVMEPQSIKCEPSLPGIETKYLVATKTGQYITPKPGQLLVARDGDLVVTLLNVGGKALDPRVTLFSSDA